MISADMHRDYSDALAIVEDGLKTLQTRLIRDHRPGRERLSGVKEEIEKALKRVRRAQTRMRIIGHE